MLRECDYSQALLEQVNQAISDKTQSNDTPFGGNEAERREDFYAYFV